MQSIAERHEEPTAIRTNLGAIFVSLELSRSIWLITSVSPGGGEKMSKRSVSAGDIAALLTRFSELGKKAFAQTGKSFPSRHSTSRWRTLALALFGLALAPAVETEPSAGQLQIQSSPARARHRMTKPGQRKVGEPSG
jgi:hypothetical protein